MSNLQEAFREAARREFAMVPDERELDYSFSPGFQRKMRRIIRAQVHGYWNMVNTLGKRIAIAAAIIVMLLTTTMAIKPIRERVIKFFVEVYEEYFEITFGEEKRGDITPITNVVHYSFSWLPEGFSEMEIMEYDNRIWTSWKDNKGNYFTLFQEKGSQTVTMNNNETNINIIYHKEITISHQSFDNSNSYLWATGEYSFLLTTYGDISTSQALRMIDSLEK